MATTISGLARTNFATPDQAEETPKRKAGAVTIGAVTIGAGTLEPGWRWSEHVKPLVGTNSCQAPHIHYLISGRLHVRMDDGAEQEFGTGDVFLIGPGHDAWVTGNAPVGDAGPIPHQDARHLPTRA